MIDWVGGTIADWVGGTKKKKKKKIMSHFRDGPLIRQLVFIATCANLQLLEIPPLNITRHGRIKKLILH